MYQRKALPQGFLGRTVLRVSQEWKTTAATVNRGVVADVIGELMVTQ
jgi:hypothetical protein